MSTVTSAAALQPLLEANLDGYPIAMSWSSNSRWLAVGTAEGNVALVDVQRKQIAQRWQAHEAGLHGVSWHPTQPLLATSGQDGYARLWQLGQADQVATVAELQADSAKSWVEHVAWRPDGKQLAVGCGKAIQVFNTAGNLEQQWQFPGSTVAALAWRPQGAQLAAGGYGGVVMYAPLAANLKPYQMHWKGSLLSLKWSPDAKVIAATCQDKSVHFWYTRDQRDSAINGFQAKSKLLAWSNNSRWLALGGGTDITVWPFDGRGPEGRAPVEITGHKEHLSALTFAPKGVRLLSGCRAGQLCVWGQVKAAAPLATMKLGATIELADWSPNSDRMGAAVTSEGLLVLWELDAR